MNAIASAICSFCFAILSVPVLLLGLLENAAAAGFAGAAICMVIAYAFFGKTEALMIEESINRRHYKGNLRNIA